MCVCVCVCVYVRERESVWSVSISGHPPVHSPSWKLSDDTCTYITCAPKKCVCWCVCVLKYWTSLNTFSSMRATFRRRTPFSPRVHLVWFEMHRCFVFKWLRGAKLDWSNSWRNSSHAVRSRTRFFRGNIFIPLHGVWRQHLISKHKLLLINVFDL